MTSGEPATDAGATEVNATSTGGHSGPGTFFFTMAELWEQATQCFDELDEIDRGRYFNLLTWWLTLHENIYHQWRNKLIDEETFSSWTRDLEFWAKRQQLANHWPQLNNFFESSFTEHVTAIIVRQKNEAG